MPYILEKDRDRFTPELPDIAKVVGKDRKELYSTLWRLGEAMLKNFDENYYFPHPNGENPLITSLAKKLGSVAGNFDYVWTYLIHHFIINSGLPFRYVILNTTVGIMDRAKQEVLRLARQGRASDEALEEFLGMYACMDKEFCMAVIYPYEQKKRRENGMVSTLDDKIYKFDSIVP